MSDLNVAIRRSKRLEHRLRDGLGARGRGLHELISSVERRLDRETVKRLRFVASVRNALVHDLEVTRFENRRAFLRAADLAEKGIDRVAGPSARDGWRMTVFVVAVIAAFLAVGVGVTLYLLAQSGVGFEWSFG